MNKDIKFDGVSVSKAFIAESKSEAEFVKVMSDKTYAHLFEGEGREAKIKQVYALAQPKTEAPKEAAPKGAGKG